MADVEVELVPNFNALVASLVADHVSKIAADVAEAAKKKAPGTKTWKSAGDGEVREQHQWANQNLRYPMPENLRWALPSIKWDIEHYGVGAGTHLLAPRDLTSGLGPDAAAIHDCRCSAVVDPFGISRKIRSTPAVVSNRGARAKATVSAFGVIQSHEGDVYPAPAAPVAGSRFMTKAAIEVAARYASR